MWSISTMTARFERVATIAAKVVALSRPGMGAARRERVAPAVENQALIAALQPDLVLDVGANRGQFALAVRAAAPDCRIMCFEPGPAAQEVLRSLFSDDDHIMIHPIAAGAAPGTLELHVTESDDNSSLLLPTDQHPGSKAARTVSHSVLVDVRPLDQVIATTELTEDTMLKIDVQGTELDVLKGATALLGHVRWLLLEASFVPSYEGQELASDLLDFASEYGFQLSHIGATTRNEKGLTVQADLLLTRR